MTEKENIKKLAKASLCVYDKRSPYYHEEHALGHNYTQKCFCDNCCEGRDQLAQIILDLLDRTNGG